MISPYAPFLDTFSMDRAKAEKYKDTEDSIEIRRIGTAIDAIVIEMDAAHMFSTEQTIRFISEWRKAAAWINESSEPTLSRTSVYKFFMSDAITKMIASLEKTIA